MSFSPFFDEPSPPLTPAAEKPAQAPSHTIWIAFALPLFIVLCGAVIAFLCWRRLRARPEPWKVLDETPPSSSTNEHGHDPLPPQTRPFARPLVLLARTVSGQTVERVRNMSQRPNSGASPPRFSVSTKVTRDGTRVLTKKNATTWPPQISWPLELHTFPATPERARGQVQGDFEDPRRQPWKEVGPGADLQRGPSLVSGYHSQSHHHQQVEHLERLVEEARGTRNSWTEGDEEAERHFAHDAQAQRARRRGRANSLSARSLSEYSHDTMGASTLANLIDREVARIATLDRDSDSTSFRSTDPSVPPPVADIRPLKFDRFQAASSGDSCSPRPGSGIHFPRLRPVPDKAVPSTSDPVEHRNPRREQFKLPPPLPYDSHPDFQTHHLARFDEPTQPVPALCPDDSFADNSARPDGVVASSTGRPRDPAEGGGGCGRESHRVEEGSKSREAEGHDRRSRANGRLVNVRSKMSERDELERFSHPNKLSSELLARRHAPVAR